MSEEIVFFFTRDDDDRLRIRTGRLHRRVNDLVYIKFRDIIARRLATFTFPTLEIAIQEAKKDSTYKDRP